MIENMGQEGKHLMSLFCIHFSVNLSTKSFSPKEAHVLCFFLKECLFSLTRAFVLWAWPGLTSSFHQISTVVHCIYMHCQNCIVMWYKVQYSADSMSLIVSECLNLTVHLNGWRLCCVFQIKMNWTVEAEGKQHYFHQVVLVTRSFI